MPLRSVRHFCYAKAVRLIGKILLVILVLAAVMVAVTHMRALKARDADQAFHAGFPKTILLHSVSFSAGGDIPAAVIVIVALIFVIRRRVTRRTS